MRNPENNLTNRAKMKYLIVCLTSMTEFEPQASWPKKPDSTINCLSSSFPFPLLPSNTNWYSWYKKNRCDIVGWMVLKTTLLKELGYSYPAFDFGPQKVLWKMH